MDKKIIKECKDILDTARDIAKEYFDTDNAIENRIAILSIARLLVDIAY